MVGQLLIQFNTDTFFRTLLEINCLKWSEDSARKVQKVASKNKIFELVILRHIF